jgi:hypothetical protein
MAFAQGDMRIGAVRRLAVACHAAAREASTPAATAVARACGQAAAVAHMAAHARAVPAYVLKAMALACPGDPAALDSEKRGSEPPCRRASPGSSTLRAEPRRLAHDVIL